MSDVQRFDVRAHTIYPGERDYTDERISHGWREMVYASDHASAITALEAERDAVKSENDRLRVVLTEARESLGWRGRGHNDTEVFYCEHCNIGNLDYTKIEHPLECLCARIDAALTGAKPSSEPVHPTYGTLDNFLSGLASDICRGYYLRIGQAGALNWFSEQYDKKDKP